MSNYRKIEQKLKEVRGELRSVTQLRTNIVEQLEKSFVDRDDMQLECSSSRRYGTLHSHSDEAYQLVDLLAERRQSELEQEEAGLQAKLDKAEAALEDSDDALQST